MPEPFDWLKKRVQVCRDERIFYRTRGYFNDAACAEARAKGLEEAIEHLEELGPLLGLDEVREKLLGGEAIAAAERARVYNLDGTNQDAMAGALSAALDTFNPPVEGGLNDRDRERISDTYHGVHDDELRKAILDPEAAIEQLPEAERKKYEECRQSIVDARNAAPANEGRNVIGTSAGSVSVSTQQGGADANRLDGDQPLAAAGIGDGLGPEESRVEELLRDEVASALEYIADEAEKNPGSVIHADLAFYVHDWDFADLIAPARKIARELDAAPTQQPVQETDRCGGSGDTHLHASFGETHKCPGCPGCQQDSGEAGEQRFCVVYPDGRMCGEPAVERLIFPGGRGSIDICAKHLDDLVNHHCLQPRYKSGEGER